MKTAFQKTVLATALIAASFQAAHAGVTISPMVGQYLFDTDMDVDNSAFGSIALGYQFDSPYAVELSYLSVSPDAENGSADLDITQIRVDALYHFDHNANVRPYLLLGAGNQTYDLGSTDYESTLLNAGAGIKADITDALALRTELRLLNDSDLELTSYSVGLGLIYEFGKKAMSTKTVPVAPSAPSDSDSDGVADASDSCPNTPAGTTVDVNGCEMVMDADKDGVTDSADQCPDTKAGAIVDAKGCYIVITETKEVSLNIVFASGSNEIPAAAHSEVEKVAQFMTQYPLTKVNIEGHTDDSGAASFNQKLSQKRAEAVAQLLIGKFNIAANRVSATGYGESQPLVPNTSAENKATNRRVTAKVSAQVESIKQ